MGVDSQGRFTQIDRGTIKRDPIKAADVHGAGQREQCGNHLLLREMQGGDVLQGVPNETARSLATARSAAIYSQIAGIST